MKQTRNVLLYTGNGSPFLSEKTGRNNKCLCGSGKKQKKCCGVETKYYSKKQSDVSQKETTKDA